MADLNFSIEPKEIDLKAVGLWRSSDDQGAFPDPKRLVYRNWHPEIDSIVRYLRAGSEARTFYGYSFCRFKCGIPDREMGSGELTDGEWAWPEGLAHYVESHSVALPDEFVETMIKNNWTPPLLPLINPNVDASFWIKWGRRKSRGGWLRVMVDRVRKALAGAE